jgi:outer membrane protein assembly factor BamB
MAIDTVFIFKSDRTMMRLLSSIIPRSLARPLAYASGCRGRALLVLLACFISAARLATAGEWPQLQYDSRRSGNVEGANLPSDLGLTASAPLTDGVYASPAVSAGRVVAIDGSGVVHCFDAVTLKPLWTRATDGGAINCNNVSSPAIVAGYVHVGTMGGNYYVLKLADGAVVAKIACGDPIFSSPVIADDRQTVYFATLGSRVHALSPEGKVRWTWDFVREVLKFDGDRYSGEAWAARGKGRVTWREQFCCSRDMAAIGKMLVIPAGGSIVWLADDGEHATIKARYAPKESPATLGLSLGSDGTVFRQWYRRDNGGSIETLKIEGDHIKPGVVDGTQSSYDSESSMGFSAVALRGTLAFRTRPEEGFGLVRHEQGAKPRPLGAAPSIAPPVVYGDAALVSGLDGALYVVGVVEHARTPYAFHTAQKRPITAAPAVCDGAIYFGGEDGYLYRLASGGKAPAPTKSLDLAKIRSPLSSKFTDAKYNWFTNFGDLANTNRTSEQDLKPPFKLRWIRRIEGTIKHLSAHGGGRMFTHTAEGQLVACEQETGRLLWRRYFPGVHVSYTAPIYSDGRVLVAQAGFEKSRVRCFDAATGEELWEAPFTGSPSWNRQLPPLVHDGRVYYCFSTGKYNGAQWLFEHQNTHGFPADHKPIVKCWDFKTGKEIWSLNFAEYGAGGDDAGLCIMNDTLYYSCYFGNKNPPGITAALDPASGKLRWKTTKYAVHGGCTISAKGGRLYLGGYNAVDGKDNHIYCLDARDGALVWQSDTIGWAIHVVTLADSFAFTHAQYQHGTMLDLAAGKRICDLTQGYNCTRFTMAGRYLLGANMDIYDTADNNRLVTTGPAVDVLLCVGAQVSNGRIFFTTNGGGLQLPMTYGDEPGGTPKR